MREKRELWVVYKFVNTSVNWGATRSNQTKLLRDSDGKIPVFTEQRLASRYLAGLFRPDEHNSWRQIRFHTGIFPCAIQDHDYFSEKRELALTKSHVVDPDPPQPPMSAEEGKALMDRLRPRPRPEVALQVES